MIQWLIENGADLSLKDEKGRTARDLAVACGMFNKLIYESCAEKIDEMLFSGLHKMVHFLDAASKKEITT